MSTSTGSARPTTLRASFTSVHTSTIMTRTTTIYVHEPSTTPSITSTDSSIVDQTLPPGRLSPTGVALLITLGAFFLFLVSIGLCRGVRTCIRRRRREKQDDSFQSSIHSEKGGSYNASGRLGVNQRARTFSKSPSSIFGGKERTGLTPNPSWMTFPEALSPGIIPSQYPLGLVAPPTALLFPHLPPGPIGLGVMTMDRTTPSVGAVQSQQAFAPPTITITSSSPRQSSQPLNRDTRDISPPNSLNSVSVYDHPVYGAQLVKPLKLRLTNADAGGPPSDCEGVTRNSGWSSWDDSVGVELGAKMDRKVCSLDEK